MASARLSLGLTAVLVCSLAQIGVAHSVGPTGSSVEGECVAAQGAPEDRYVVTLDENSTAADVQAAADDAAAEGATIHFRYEYAIKGFAATLPPRAMTAVEEESAVTAVDPDVPVCLADTGTGDWTAAADATQTSPPWGLDRIDQRSLPLSGSYSYGNDGAGVKVYVIDSGIRATHAEFGGRVLAGADFSGAGSTNDVVGHGTNIAALAGGSTFGVAKGVSLVPVRVFGNSGSTSTSVVIAGINYVIAQHNADPATPAVANLSLGVGGTALDSAAANLVAAGVTTVVAAGNDAGSACNDSPARVSTALTVAASTINDARASFSNTGSCVDLFAPGDGLISASPASDTAVEDDLDGTSFAVPLVAGSAATYLQGAPTATPSEVGGAILATATPGVVAGAGSGTPNRLLFSPLTVPPVTPAPTPAPPTTVPRPAPGAPRCLGRTATIVGSANANRITGTSGVDVIVGRGGADRIDGRGGADLICGGDGNDTLIGGRGNDFLSGGAGRDRLRGGYGRDYCAGGSGRDTVTGC